MNEVGNTSNQKNARTIFFYKPYEARADGIIGTTYNVGQEISSLLGFERPHFSFKLKYLKTSFKTINTTVLTQLGFFRILTSLDMNKWRLTAIKF